MEPAEVLQNVKALDDFEAHDYIRLKPKSFALKRQIMTQGRPAGRIGGKYPWCQSTLFSYKKRHTFFPQGRFFGVLGFLRRLARGKDYSFYFYFIIIPQGTFGGNSDDFEARQLGQQTTSIATSTKLTGYHKPLCLHKNHKHSCTNQFIPITSELQRSAYWSEGPDHQGGGQLSRTPHIMSACIITSARHSASSVIIRRGPLRNSDFL